MSGITDRAITAFWAFVLERQRVWYRRHILRLRPPWTEDPILQANHFTNVYRELDPGTEFAVGILLREAPLEERLLNLMVYRLIGREETMRALGWIGLPFEPARFRAILEAQRDKGPVFGGAYMVNSYAAMGWGDKVLNVTALLKDLTTPARWVPFWHGVCRFAGLAGFEEASRRSLHEHISSVYGWGRFLAFQVLVDLAYPLPDPTNSTEGPALLPGIMSNYGGWATAGPGTLRGLRRIWPKASVRTANDAMASMEAAAAAPGGHLEEGAPPGDPKAEVGGPYASELRQRAMMGSLFPLPLSRANIANCLCEWDKYERLREGGPARRPFNGRRSWHADLEARGHGAQLEMLP